MTAYLTQARDGFVNVAEMPGSWNLPYQLDAKGTGLPRGAGDGRHAKRGVQGVPERRRCAPADLLQGVQLGSLPSSAPITFDTLFKPGTKPLDVIYPDGQPVPAEAAGD